MCLHILSGEIHGILHRFLHRLDSQAPKRSSPLQWPPPAHLHRLESSVKQPSNFCICHMSYMYCIYNIYNMYNVICMYSIGSQVSLGFKGHFFRTFPDTWETPWFPRSFAWLPVAAAKEAAEVFGAQMFPPDSGRRLKFQVGLELYTLHQVGSIHNSWYVHIYNIYIYN